MEKVAYSIVAISENAELSNPGSSNGVPNVEIPNVANDAVANAVVTNVVVANGGAAETEMISIENKTDEDEVPPITWHTLPIEAILRILECPSNCINVDEPRMSKGLGAEEVKIRFTRDGPNTLTPPKERSAILQYLAKYLDPFMIGMNISGIMSLIVWILDTTVLLNLYLSLVLFVIVIVSSTFAYIQEGRSRAVMSQFVKLMPRNCRILRDGKEIITNASELVIGDIVHVQGGDSVPADIRLFWVNELKVETSSLTGESLPITSTIDAKEDEKMVEASNLLWSSCNVLEGEGYGIVFATGDKSMIGRIHELTDNTQQVDSTLQKEIRRFVFILAGFAGIQAIVFYAIALARHKDPLQSLVYCFIVIVVANVPQGLPSTVISLLTVAGKRLADSNVNVKRLQNVETLGSCTVICSDKTGTITQNKMSVSHIWIDASTITSDFARADMPAFAMRNSIINEVILPMSFKKSSFNVLAGSARNNSIDDIISIVHPVRTLANLELVAALCNRARFEDEKILNDKEIESLLPLINIRTASKQASVNKMKLMEKLQEDSKRKINGDASDKALFQFVSSRQIIEIIRYQYHILYELPFSSKNKYALTVISPRGNNKKKYLLMKGAPEVVLSRCTKYQYITVPKPIDEDFLIEFDKAYRSYAQDGERVLGFAWIDISEIKIENNINIQLSDLPINDYEFIGLMSLVDPPKPKVQKAVEECRSAGIKVIMVTGDHPLTAGAIANEVGIMNSPTKSQLAIELDCKESEIDDTKVDAILVTGAELEKFTDRDWNYVLNKKEIVFARTTPEHKLKIVGKLQEQGHIVAVTGDGVNDAPALKKGDIGVAMGINGSDVARGAGDIVLMDDDFSSIVLGIKEGRVVFDNLAKTSAYTLTHLWPEVVPVLVNIAFDLPLAMNSLNVLCIDCGTELAPAISYAYERPEYDVMKRPPRNSKTERLASWKLLSYSYIQAGTIETIVAFLGYLLIFAHYNVPLSDLPLSGGYWTSTSKDYKLSNGIILTADEQVSILSKAQTMYWFIVVVCQIFHVFLGKTRTQSIFTHGIFSNIVTDYGVVIESALVIIFIFVPGISDVLLFTYKIPLSYWFIFLIGWFILLILTEGIKFCLRKGYPTFIVKYFGF